MHKIALLLLNLLRWSAWTAFAEESKEALEAAIRAVEAKVIAWRSDIHEHPELSNRKITSTHSGESHV